MPGLISLVALTNASMPQSFGVYYDVIGTANFNGCTYSVRNGRWGLSKNCFDKFQSSSPGASCFSPSHASYAWLGWNQLSVAASFLVSSS
jgi:hypothetical protein